MKTTTMSVLWLLAVLLSGCASAPKHVYGVTSLRGLSNGPDFDGRIVAVHNFPYRSLQPGWFVLRYDGEGSRTCHQLIYRDGPLWVMQGANRLTNPYPDARLLSPSNYAGVVCDPDTFKPIGGFR